MFWAIAGLTGLPGFYVMYRLRHAWLAPAGSEERKRRIRELPDM